VEIDEITSQIIRASIRIHTALGPGLLESIYEEVLTYELVKSGLFVERQVPIPVLYEGLRMNIGFRADVIVEKKVLVEIKSVEIVSPVHKKKAIGYLKLTGLKIGLLINFNEELLKNGITRLFNNFVD